MEPITIPFTLTEDDYIRAYRLYTYRKISYPMTQGIYLVVILVGLIGFLLWNGNADDPLVWLPVLLTVLAFLVYQWAGPTQTKTQIRKNKQLTMPGVLELTEQEVLLRNEMSQTSYRWENFSKFYENSDYVYFTTTHDPKAYLFIPKRCFSSPRQIEQFRLIANQKLNHAAGK